MKRSSFRRGVRATGVDAGLQTLDHGISGAAQEVVVDFLAGVLREHF